MQKLKTQTIRIIRTIRSYSGSCNFGTSWLSSS